MADRPDATEVPDEPQAADEPGAQDEQQAAPGGAPAASDRESAVRDREDAAAAARARSAAARRAALVGARILTGAIATAAVAAVVAAAGLLPVPDLRAEPAVGEVVPVPADQTRVCPGAALRLGDTTGQDAGTAAPIDAASVVAGAVGGDVARAPLASGPSGAEVLTLPSGDERLVAGAQAQSVATDDVLGFAAAACAEPSSSSWLVGGATTVGRTTLLSLANPSDVDASVTIRIFTEAGEVDAPGMRGIVIGPGSQRVLPIAGFVRDAASPVVHVESRGGRVASSLQQSTLRSVDPGGLEIIGEAAPASTETVIPGVRIGDVETTARALALSGYEDLATVVRIGVPGDQPVRAEIVVRRDGGAEPVTSTIVLEPGRVTDVPIEELVGGRYSVTVLADQPVVAAVRASVSAPPSARAARTDLAWFPSAQPIEDEQLVAVADGPSPLLSVANPGDDDVSATLERPDGEAVELEVPAGRSISIRAGEGVLRISGGAGLRATVTYGGATALAATPVVPPRPVSAPIVVRP